MPHRRQAPDPARGDEHSGVAARAGGVVVALQGVGLLGVGAYLLVRVTQGDSQHAGSTALLGVLSLLAAAGMFAMARAVDNRRRRVRGPLLTLEIICVPIAITIVQGGRWYVGVPLAVVAVVVVILMGVAGLLGPETE